MLVRLLSQTPACLGPYEALGPIAEGGMAVDRQWERIPEEALRGEWYQFRLGPVWGLVIAVFAIWVGLRYANDEEIV